MTDTLEEFRDKFRVDELLLLESEHWTWSLRPGQSTLGAGILALKRFCDAMGSATAEELVDLAAIARPLEDRLTEVFAPDKMNYLMLMMVDAHLHFHVFPRYDRTVPFGGKEWPDAQWPGPPQVVGDPTDTGALHEIRDALRPD